MKKNGNIVLSIEIYFFKNFLFSWNIFQYDTIFFGINALYEAYFAFTVFQIIKYDVTSYHVR